MSRRNNNNRSLLSIALETRPHSTSSRIVFPWDQLSQSFSQHDYNPIATQGVVSEEDVTRVLNSLKSSKDYIPKRNKCLQCSIFLCFVLYFAYIFLVVSIGGKGDKDDKDDRRDGMRHNKDEDTKVGHLVAIFLGVFVFILAICCIGSKIEKQFKESLDRRMKDFEGVLRDFNENEFSARDVEWKVGNFGAWITLELNYVLRNNVMAAGRHFAGGENFSTGLPILNINRQGGNFEMAKLQPQAKV